MIGGGADASKDMLAQYVRQLLDADEHRQRSQIASLSTYASKSSDGPMDELWNKSSMPCANTDVSSSASVSTYYGTRSSDGASSGGGYSPDSPENSENSGSEATSSAAVVFQGPPPGLGSFSDAKALPSTQKANVQHCSQQLQHATGVLQAALANWEAALQSEEVRSSASSTIPSHEDVHVLEPVTVPLPSKFVSPCVSATAAVAAPPPLASSTNVNTNARGLAQLHKAIGDLTSALQGESQTPAAVGAAAENKASNDASMQAVKLLRQHVEKQQKESALKVQKLLQEQQRQLAAEALSNALAAAAADVFAKQRQPGETPWATPSGVANLQQHLAALGHPGLAGAAGLQCPAFGLGAPAGMPATTLASGPAMRNSANLTNTGGLASAAGFGGILESRHPQPTALGVGVTGMPHMQAALWSAQLQAQQQAQQQVQQQAMTQRPAKMPPRQGNTQQLCGNSVPKGCNGSTLPPRRGVPAPKAPGGEEETLRTHLRDLQKVEPDRVVLVRKINRLGFDSPAALEAHYSRYGTVERTLVAHSHVKSQNRRIAARLRPSGLGFVVMSSKEEVEAILRDGAEQMVSGALIRVQNFKRCCGENLDGDEDLLIEDDGEADATEV